MRGTAFQQRVWQALQEIPVGRTASHTDIAKRIGLPKAARAVAQACAANTLAVAIPCHRVIRNDGPCPGIAGEWNASAPCWGERRKGRWAHECGRQRGAAIAPVTAQRTRMQSRVEVVPLGQGDAVAFAMHQRSVQGARVYRVNFRHGVSHLHSGHRHTAGIIFHDAT